VSVKEPDFHKAQKTPLFLRETFKELRHSTLPGSEIGRLVTAADRSSCDQRCLELGCTAYTLYGAYSLSSDNAI